MKDGAAPILAELSEFLEADELHIGSQPGSFISISAFSSQKRMSISR
jgi:hypothetical protein